MSQNLSRSQLSEVQKRFLQEQDTLYAQEGLSYLSRQARIVSSVIRAAGHESGLAKEHVSEALRDTADYFKRTYDNLAVPTQGSVAFVRVFRDAYPIQIEHPWAAPLAQLDAKSTVLPEKVCIRGLPEYLWAELSLRQQNIVLRRVQECQVHFARLQALEEKGTQYLALAAVDLRQAAYSACAGDYNAARWSALHACEKILKSVIQAHGVVPKKTHTLEKLVTKVKSLTGLSITPSRFDGLKFPAQLRYSQGSTFARAELTFIQTLRILSFLFPVLQGKYDYKDGDWGRYRDHVGAAWMDKAICVSNYPGFVSSAYWQKPFTGVYGAPIDFD